MASGSFPVKTILVFGLTGAKRLYNNAHRNRSALCVFLHIRGIKIFIFWTDHPGLNKTAQQCDLMSEERL